MTYSIISCRGFTEVTTGWFTSGACLKARIGLVILFFVIALIRKWGGEEVGLSFSFLLSLIGGLGTYLGVIFFIGAFKWAFIIGIIAALICGYVGGSFLGGED